MNQLYKTKDGSLTVFSNQFGEAYHSIHGAIQETQHVFINAGFRPKALLSEKIDVLDIGFGSGLNAFMTYLEAKKRNVATRYVGIEAFPISVETADQLNYSEQLDRLEEKSVLLQMHECAWNVPHQICEEFTFTKNKMKFQEIDYQDAFDLIYFDAFAPAAQPELWEDELLGAMYDALRKDGILVTYCAKGVVKRTLKSLGFTVEAIQGPPGKREMTRAYKQ